MKFTGIIFDFNGVLLWDSRLHVQAWQQSALKLRGYEFSDDEFSIHVHGRTNSHILNYLTGRALEGEELSELIQMKETVYRNLCLAQGKLFALSPGAREGIGEKISAHAKVFWYRRGAPVVWGQGTGKYPQTLFSGKKKRVCGISPAHPIHRLNMQRAGNKAKPYQVRQVSEVLLKYHLAGE